MAKLITSLCSAILMASQIGAMEGADSDPRQCDRLESYINQDVFKERLKSKNKKLWQWQTGTHLCKQNAEAAIKQNNGHQCYVVLNKCISTFKELAVMFKKKKLASPYIEGAEPPSLDEMPNSSGEEAGAPPRPQMAAPEIPVERAGVPKG